MKPVGGHSDARLSHAVRGIPIPDTVALIHVIKSYFERESCSHLLQ